jgi:hypothetical protein
MEGPIVEPSHFKHTPCSTTHGSINHQDNTVQCSAVQCSAVQCSALLTQSPTQPLSQQTCKAATASSGAGTRAAAKTAMPPAAVNSARPCRSWQMLPMLLQHSCFTAALLLSWLSHLRRGDRAPACMARTLVS